MVDQDCEGKDADERTPLLDKCGRIIEEKKPKIIWHYQNTTIIAGFKQKHALHPIIDVFDSKAFVGVWLPCKIAIEKKRETRDEFESKNIVEDSGNRLFMITSQRENLFCEKEALSDYNLVVQEGFFETPQNRWGLDDVEAWLYGTGVQITPKELYEAIKQRLRFYIEFTDEKHYDLITLWIIGTYFFHIFRAYPYIFIGGTKRSGKSKLLYFVTLLAFNGIKSVSITTASLFRTIQNLRPTLAIDETEKLHDSDRNQEIRAVLLGGYKPGDYVIRCEGEKTIKTAYFETYCPKIIGNIQGIEDVLEDRTIPIVMMRAHNLEIKKREIDKSKSEWQQIRNQLYRFYLSKFTEIRQIYEDVSVGSVGSAGSVGVLGEGGISGREHELWSPVIALAKFFENEGVVDLYRDILDLAAQIIAEKEVENATESADMIVLDCLDYLVMEDDWYSIRQIKEETVKRYEDDPPKWMNATWIGRCLKRFGLKEKRRVGTGIEYRIKPEQIKDLIQRLGGPTPKTPTLHTLPTQPTQDNEDYICEVCNEPCTAPDLFLISDEKGALHPYHKACRIKMMEEEKRGG